MAPVFLKPCTKAYTLAVRTNRVLAIRRALVRARIGSSKVNYEASSRRRWFLLIPTVSSVWHIRVQCFVSKPSSHT